jgi:hypothetical protein
MKLFKKLIKNLFFILGYRLEKIDQFRKEQMSYLKENSFKTLTLNELAKKINNDLKKLNVKTSHEIIRKEVLMFYKIFKNFSIPLQGGMGFNNLLQLFISIKVLKPEIIIESGVWRGCGTYFIEKAMGKKTKLFCFDISFRKLKYKSKDAKYIEKDLTNFLLKLEKKNKKVMVIFDDHVSHHKRISLSLKKKIDFIFLDDDCSSKSIHVDFEPPIPSAKMIFQNNYFNGEIKWVNRNRHFKLRTGLKKNYKIIKDRYSYLPFSNLRMTTGYDNYSECCLLKLKKND